MASLTGTKIKDTYDALLKVSDNGALDGTLQTITDGLGNNSSLGLSTAGASVTGTLAVSGNAAFDTDTLFVDASNNRVGILTSSPSFNLDVRGTANFQGTATAQLFLQSNSGGYYSSINVGGTGNGLGYTTGELYIANPSNVITFNTKTSSGESMRIDSSGNVGINTQNLYGKLSVEAAGSHITLRANTASAGKYWALDVTSGNQFYILNNAGTQYLTMTDSGNVGIGGSPTQKLSVFAPAAIVDITSTTGTNFNGLELKNTGGSFYVGQDNSSGGFYGSGSAYAASLYNAANTPMVFFTNATERMSIDSSGNVSISSGDLFITGDNILDVTQGNNASYFRRNASQYIAISSDSTYHQFAFTGSKDVYFNNTTANSMMFATNNAERMRITSEGKTRVGNEFGDIGGRGASLQVSGGEALLVYGYGNGYGIGLFMRPNSSASDSTTHVAVQFARPDNTYVGSITTNGSSTAYNTSSDYRLKEDWQPMSGALDRVDALKPINFAWKSSGDRVDGFLAHELAEVVPEAVTGEKDATEIRSVEVSPAVYEDIIHPAEEAILDEEGNVIQEAKEEWVEKVLVSEAVFEDQEFPVYQGIDQSKIVPLLVAGLQEAHELIKSLQARIETLENA